MQKHVNTAISWFGKLVNKVTVMHACMQTQWKRKCTVNKMHT